MFAKMFLPALKTYVSQIILRITFVSFLFLKGLLIFASLLAVMVTCCLLKPLLLGVYPAYLSAFLCCGSCNLPKVHF